MAQEPPSHSFTAPKKSMRPKPTMQSTTPRRMSERCRTAGVGGASKGGGIGWPFSAIIGIVRCIMRFLEKQKYMMTATISTGAPKIVNIVLAAIGKRDSGILSDLVLLI